MYIDLFWKHFLYSGNVFLFWKCVFILETFYNSWNVFFFILETFFYSGNVFFFWKCLFLFWKRFFILETFFFILETFFLFWKVETFFYSGKYKRFFFFFYSGNVCFYSGNVFFFHSGNVIFFILETFSEVSPISSLLTPCNSSKNYDWS